MWVCGLFAPRWDNRNLTSSDLLSSWWRVCDSLVTGRQKRTKKLVFITAWSFIFVFCDFAKTRHQKLQPIVFKLWKGCGHVFANVSFLILQMQKSEFAKCRNNVCKSCFWNLQSLVLVLWKMRMQDLHVDVHRIARWHKSRFFENDCSNGTFSDTRTPWFPLVRDLASGRGQPVSTIPTTKTRNGIISRSVFQMVASAQTTTC